VRIERSYQIRHPLYFSRAAQEAAFFDAGIVADGRCFVKVVAATQTSSQRFTEPPDQSRSKGISGPDSRTSTTPAGASFNSQLSLATL
jgi:hypothetical protein